MKGGRLPFGAVLVRSLLLQASWNYRTMIGTGFAFALLPWLRRLAKERDEPLDVAVARHAERFNAHPYLCEVALGATARMEADGVSPEMIRRFKMAIGGPLGGLGDVLVWATWLPLTLLVSLLMAWSGVSPLVCVTFFLVIYNLGHLSLRIWGLKTGWSAGKEVGGRLRSAHLGVLSDRGHRIGAFLVGGFLSLLVLREPGFSPTPGLWPTLAVAAFVVGLLGGPRAWRPAALAVVIVIVAIFLFPYLT